jgi:hypothetical protein
MANKAPPKKEAPEPEAEAEVEPEEIVPTSLDEQTHSELLNLIDESSRTIRFAKAQQWRTVGSTLVVFLVLVAMARFVSIQSEVRTGLGDHGLPGDSGGALHLDHLPILAANGTRQAADRGDPFFEPLPQNPGHQV